LETGQKAVFIYNNLAVLFAFFCFHFKGSKILKAINAQTKCTNIKHLSPKFFMTVVKVTTISELTHKLQSDKESKNIFSNIYLKELSEENTDK